MSNETKKGWGWPVNSQKAHYFHGGLALCRGWAYTGELESGNDNSPDNCAKCKKLLGVPSPATPKFIVELETGCWIASGQGDPPRTVVKANAKVFRSRKAAERAYASATKYRPFINAHIFELPHEQEANCEGK